MINTQTICITGASSGIGKALALNYAKANTILLLIGRDKTRLDKTAAACEQYGALVKTALIDVTHQLELNQWLLEQDKENPIDLLIANAGNSVSQLKEVIDNDLAVERKMIDTHFNGTLNTLHPIIERMKQREQGQLAIMSSMNALIPLSRSALYGAIKAGLLHYGLALRATLYRYNIGVSVICPGFVDSAITAKNNFPMPFKLSAATAANKISAGIDKNKAVVRFPWPYRFAIACFHCLPQAVKTRISAKI